MRYKDLIIGATLGAAICGSIPVAAILFAALLQKCGVYV